MKNKVLKNVVLSLCILGLVLFPVEFIFAASYTFNNATAFCNAINPNITWTGNNYVGANSLFIYSLPAEFNLAYQYVLSQYNIAETDVWYVQLQRTSSTNYCVTVFSSPSTYVVGGYPERLTGSYCPYLSLYTNVSGTLYKSSVTYSTADNTYVAATQTVHNGSSGMGGNPKNTQLSYFAGIYPVKLVISPNNSYNDFYTLDPSYNPGGGNTPGNDDGFEYESYTNPLTPSNVTSYVDSSTPFTYDIYESIINDPNYDPTDAWQHYRVMVGLFPMMWEYYFRWFSNMSLGYMDDIASNLQEMVTMADNMQDIADRLALAFPDDQAELNDSIAETLLDDTNGTGLTADKVSNAKSDFDEGVSMYQIDTSQSQYSTPFSAIRSGDWSFWSSTTLNNLGPGYQYTYTPQTRSSKKASNDDDDIFESNQKSLFDLLGW